MEYSEAPECVRPMPSLLGLGLLYVYCALELGSTSITGWWNDSLDDSIERIGYTRKILLYLTMASSLISLINMVASIGYPVCA